MKTFNLADAVDTLGAIKDGVLIIRQNKIQQNNLIKTIHSIYNRDNEIKAITFDNCEFSKDIIFESYTLSKELKFENCSFYGEVHFIKCNFETEISFHNSVFHKIVSFDDCRYSIYHFDFSDIETKSTCKYFKIVNTRHNQKYDKPAYTILDFSKAVFNSEVAFTELTDLSFTFDETIFNNKFYFTNTRLGAKTIIENVRYPRVVVGGNLTKIDLKRCLQTLLGALDTQRTLLCDVDKIKERIKALDDKEEIIQLDKVYSEQQMMDEAYIGRPAFQRLKSEVRKGKIQFKLPKPCCEKPLKYKRDEVEAFIKEVARYRSEQKSKKKKK